MADVTEMLVRSRQGDHEALKTVYELLFRELEQAARAQLRQHARPVLQTHALVNESFLKLVEQNAGGLENRAHFLAVAATVMRHVLVDHFRRSAAMKRGGPATPVTFIEEQMGGVTVDNDLLALDEALTKLHRTDARLASVVECKFFGGMNYDEIALALGIAARTARLDWQKAKAWLSLELRER